MTASNLDIDRVLRETFVAQVEHHRVITSTNDRARQCATEGSSQLPLLVVADQQTAGRGRGSSRWWSPAGGLTFSLLLEAGSLAADRTRSRLVSLAAAVAVVETVVPLAPQQEVGIHWPNDVFVAGRKLAGILVEVLPDLRHVVGIGLNTNNRLDEAPPELQQTATTLLELTHQAHDQTAILVGVLNHLAGWLDELVCRPERIAARADSLCLQHGRTLTLRWGGRSITGCCAGIAPDGSLLLHTAQGREAFASGTLCASGPSILR